MGDVTIVHVVDDDPAIRDSLGLLLMTEGFEVRTHASARGFLKAVSADETGCVVTDVRMPEMSGFELLAKMKDRRLALPVIVITAHADIPIAIQAMKQGAVDLLEKPFEENTLLDSVRHALTPDNSEQARAAEIEIILARFATLTGRESEVLAGLLEGQPNKTIAHDLRISVRTVEVHRANVMAKMKAASLAALLRMSLLVRAHGRN